MSLDIHQPASSPTQAAEPTVDRGSTPLWLIILFALLFYVGMLYLDNHGGGFNAMVYAPYASFDQLQNAQPQGNDLSAKGKQIFDKNCSVCHQATGMGTPGQFPPLAGSEWVAAQAPNRIIRIVLNGAQGPITVEDHPFNNAMVPWKDVLKDEEIAAVLTYVRGNKDWHNSAPPVTPEQVKAIREKIKDRNTPFSPDEELSKLPETD